MEDQGYPEYQEKEARVSEMISALPILVAQLDTHYRIQFASEGYRVWFGLEPRDQVGHHISEVIGHKAFRTLKPWFDTALAGTQTTYHGEVPYAHCGTRFIHGIYVPYYSYHGTVTGLQIVANDLTEHRAIKKQLADETLRNHTIIQHAIDGIVTINQDGIIQSFNPAAERLFRVQRLGGHRPQCQNTDAGTGPQPPRRVYPPLPADPRAPDYWPRPGSERSPS